MNTLFGEFEKGDGNGRKGKQENTCGRAADRPGELNARLFRVPMSSREFDTE
jgi:hypothetical protein